MIPARFTRAQARYWLRVHEGDRWRVPRHRDYYTFRFSRYNGVLGVWLYHVTPRERVELKSGFPEQVAPTFKELVRALGLEPVRRPVRERTGPYFRLWWQ